MHLVAYLQPLQTEEPPCTQKAPDDCACQSARTRKQAQAKNKNDIRSNAPTDNSAHVQLTPTRTFMTTSLKPHRPKQRRNIDRERSLPQHTYLDKSFSQTQTPYDPSSLPSSTLTLTCSLPHVRDTYPG
jgi:hypothetical protein